ncbi:Aldehyde/histidinol dehydrogenase [Aspergillus falconensis]
MDTQIPGLQFSSPEAISASIRATRKSSLDHKVRDVEFRLVQLRKFYWAIKDHEEDIVKACAQDLNKPCFETESLSGWLLSDIVFTTRNLLKWMKDEEAPDIDLSFKFMKPKTRKDPRDCVLVIGLTTFSIGSGTFNLPFQLRLGPVIGAIAAGNTVIIKPSENAPHSAVPMCYSIVQGDEPEAQALLSQCWDKIFFTGRGALTPVVLELGGIDPVIVAKTTDPRLVARRMLWGSNNGKILLGSTLNEKELFIEPTVSQSIGPFIPILPVNNLDEAINLANSVQCIPLGLDPFGSNDDIAKTFDIWVHSRPITISPGWLESILAIRFRRTPCQTLTVKAKNRLSAGCALS